MSKWQITFPVVTNFFFFYFPLQILHFARVCMGAFKGMLVCRVQLISCPQYLNMSSQCSCSSCGSFGAWQRRREHGLIPPFSLACSCLCFHVQNRSCQSWKYRFSWLDNTWLRCIPEYVKQELPDGNSGKGIVCRAQSDHEGASHHCYMVRAAGLQLEVWLSFCVL